MPFEEGLENIFSDTHGSPKPAAEPSKRQAVWRVKMFKDYEANPSPMPLADVYSALQSGVMDAQENPFPQIASAKFYEVQKLLSLTGHVDTPAYLVIGEDVWSKLPKDIQSTLSKIAWDLGDFARSEGERLDKELMGKLSPPMKVNEADKEAFIKASAAGQILSR